jgi:hypothetical protein
MIARMGLVVGTGLTLLVGRGSAQRLPGDSARIEQLRQMIEDRFAERLSVELDLRGEQETRVRRVLATWSAKRRTLEREEREARRDLTAEMRPGVAADEARVNRLVDAIVNGRLDYAQTFKDELRDLTSLLDPIQRAQYVLLRERLLQRIEDIREQRAQRPLGPRRR